MDKQGQQSPVDKGAVERPTIDELLQWAEEQRAQYRAGTLTKSQIKILEETPGWTWNSDRASSLNHKP
jgi:hypothetical protein